MTNTYSQRYAAGDSNTAGTFLFDVDDAAKDIGVSKIVFGADGAAITRVTASVGLPVQLLAGTAAVGKLAANSGVDIGDVDVTSIIPGTGATNLGKAEDAAHNHSDTGVFVLAVRRDVADSGTGTDGDYASLNVDSTGRLWCNVSNTVTVAAHAVTNAGTFAVQVDGTALTRLTDIETNTDSCAVVGNGAAATAQRVTLANDSTGVLATLTTLTGGGVAHDGADSGNPHKIGAKATTALSGLTLVADADRTDLRAGVDGVLINRPHTGLEDIVSGNASNTDGASTQCIAASGAGVKTYLQTIILTNTSSSNTYCEIKDGTTVKLTIPVPANGGAVVNLPVPIGGTANTAWNFDPGAATTTMYCSMVGWKSKV